MIEWLQTLPIDWASLFGGGILVMLAGWFAKFIDNKAAAWISRKLSSLEDKIEGTTIGAQVEADNALFAALDSAIPAALLALPEAIKVALADGKLGLEDLKVIALAIWEAAQPHITGGAHDYLKKSSFEDGRAVALMIFKRWMAKRKKE